MKSIGVDMAAIFKRKAEFDFATPENPTTIRNSNLDILKQVNPDNYKAIIEKIKIGAVAVI